MLRKLLVGFVLVIYLITSTGFALNLHYCGKKISSVSLTSANSCCKKKAPAMKCCHDKKVEVRLSKDQVQSETSKAAPSPVHVDLFLEPVSRILQIFSPKIFAASLSGHDPPLVSDQPVYLQNCVFRI